MFAERSFGRRPRKQNPKYQSLVSLLIYVYKTYNYCTVAVTQMRTGHRVIGALRLRIRDRIENRIKLNCELG